MQIENSPGICWRCWLEIVIGNSFLDSSTLFLSCTEHSTALDIWIVSKNSKLVVGFFTENMDYCVQSTWIIVSRVGLVTCLEQMRVPWKMDNCSNQNQGVQMNEQDNSEGLNERESKSWNCLCCIQFLLKGFLILALTTVPCPQDASCLLYLLQVVVTY